MARHAAKRTAPGRSAGARKRPSRGASASLGEYKRKRHFAVTPEPVSGLPSKGLPRFTIQKHDATRLHYDFRLEEGGVLKSWAVPKGPSLDPADKRLAVRTEDHPLDYIDFEGVIPEGEYGGGPVIVWDTGTYLNIKQDKKGNPIPMSKAIEMGTVEVFLQGKKLRGGFALIRTRGGAPGKENWLLIKTRDEHAQPGRDILSERPESAISGRTIEDVLAEEGTQSLIRKKQAKAASRPAAQQRSPQPTWVAPMLATLVEEPPSGAGWVYEPKLDGFRALAFREGGDIRLLSRNKKDLGTRFPQIVEALGQQPVRDLVLDGEVVALDSKGRPSFSELQQHLKPTTLDIAKRTRPPIYYYVFDLLFARGFDTRELPQVERSRLLREAVDPRALIRITEQLRGDGGKLLKQACAKGWEGLIAKRIDAPYVSGKRTTHWLKLKCIQEQEFVIGGFTDPEGSRSSFGSLLVGYHDKGRLIYAGKVGSGYTEQMLKDLYRQLKPMERRDSPFEPDPDIPRRAVHFVEPKLVAEVAFTEWTHDGHIRHPRFRGLRIDKDAKEVVLERPIRQRSRG